MPDQNRIQKYNEICGTCHLRCKGTGTTFIDGTRICKWCLRIRKEDIKYLQETCTRGYPYSSQEIIVLLRHPSFIMHVERK
jgi:hypothetical protein